ncbi:protein YebF [Mangrovibacter yixingensis]|uniref:protein YebF n=1 Tax=Mangrovibacter yixingensis TaxID=1529639 RepID=UPI001CF9FEBC|nr:protein YebF [Mangrovibacter yixingensis]
MNKTGILTGCMAAFALLAVSVTVDAAAKRVSFISCENMKADNIAATVKNDYLQNQLQRWSDDQKALGQNDPVAWVNVKDMHHNGDTWVVPLVVRGKKQDLHYQVTVDCKAGSADYQR